MVNINKTQTSHRIRLCKFTTERPLEDNYNKEKFRPDDAFVIYPDNLYTIAWEAESDPSPGNCPKVYRDPVTTGPTNSGNVVAQQNIDELSSQKHSDASHFVNDEPHSHEHSKQNQVNTPKNDLRIDIDALNENDGTSKSYHDLNSRHDTESTTSKEVIIPSNNDIVFQDETFWRGGKNNLQPHPKPNFS